MLDNFFKFKENGTDFKTEIIAGITTFLAMAYILGVNPVILSEGGMPATGVLFATVVSSGIACIIMGLVAKYPVGLAPGMGLNALFTGIVITLILYLREVPAAVFVGLVVTAIIGVIFTSAGFGTGNALMPSVPAQFISTNFDLSLVFGFTRGFAQLFTNISNMIMMLFSLLFVTFFDHRNARIPRLLKARMNRKLGIL